MCTYIDHGSISRHIYSVLRIENIQDLMLFDTGHTRTPVYYVRVTNCKKREIGGVHNATVRWQQLWLSTKDILFG